MSNESKPTGRLPAPVARLVQLANELVKGIAENDKRKRDQTLAIEQQHVELAAQMNRQGESAITELELEFTEKLEVVRRRLEDQVNQLESQRGTRSDEIALQRSEAIEGAKSDCEQAELQIKDRKHHDEIQLKQTHQQFVQRCDQGDVDVEVFQTDAVGLLSQRGVQLPTAQVQSAADKNGWSSTLIRKHESTLQALADTLLQIRKHPASRFISEGWTVLLFIAVALLATYPFGRMLAFSAVPWLISVAAAAGLATLAAYLWAHRKAARLVREKSQLVSDQLQLAGNSLEQAKLASKRETASGLEELVTRADEELAAANRARQKRCDEAEATFEQQVQTIESAFNKQLQAYEKNWNDSADKIRHHYRPLIDTRRGFFEQQQQQLEESRSAKLARVESAHAEINGEFHERWRLAIVEYRAYLEQVERHAVHRRLTMTTDADGQEVSEWAPPTTVPTAIPIGQYQYNLAKTAPSLPVEGVPELLPALLSFPENGSMIIRTQDDGREAAIPVLRNAALQMLASFPPGKVRMTLIDPVGLGESFSGFMHLTDYDERLVGNRIWTEENHINQRFVDLTEHMENVIQTYLRNEYSSIQEYNEAAGEVAEPFRLLVIANFPHRFSDEAMRRLVSIASSGARCGIYTLISVDTNAKLPDNFQLEDIESNAKIFRWQDDTKLFVDTDPLMFDLPLTFDAPPNDYTQTELIRHVGRHAQETQRVQVPFSAITPAPADVWQSNCDEELTVSLGRSGATKLMSMKLGRGTSQHVLISGKTGSGKSTLLNALITNAALHYSPNELQFFLIDFKKGVEFKAYADLKLPHAQVIAIESEREFGLSVLERLDFELQRRGDLYRDSGVQSLAAYRKKNPDNPMPRLLLIVDEFQEFFVNDDKIGHDASLLLDRLVRQGRAFGIHVILGSQTLAGAYSLARATIGQMAVRVALQCSAADAHLILSEDNTAARLLGRPGEAIYNDANGTVEGNHPFQVVWLPDEERNDSLAQVRARADADPREFSEPIVFEGHAMANLSTNRQLRKSLQQRPDSAAKQVARAWLGSAVAIKDPTSVTFRRQGGSNLLVVGQSEELAMGVLSSCIISLVAAHSYWNAKEGHHCGAAFYILDGGRADVAETEFGDHLQAHLTVPLNVSGVAQTGTTLQPIAKQVETRLENPDVRGEPIYLIVHDLARFRDLRPDPDDFGLGSFGDAPVEKPSAHFAKILRDGPSVGVHVLMWADCYHTVSRALDRNSLRDVSNRLLFQMSATDSSHLMDSAGASNLGAYRGLLCDHDRGQSEKFRPYGIPTSEWLQQFQAGLNQIKPTNIQARSASE